MRVIVETGKGEKSTNKNSEVHEKINESEMYELGNLKRTACFNEDKRNLKIDLNEIVYNENVNFSNEEIKKLEKENR